MILVEPRAAEFKGAGFLGSAASEGKSACRSPLHRLLKGYSTKRRNAAMLSRSAFLLTRASAIIWKPWTAPG